MRNRRGYRRFQREKKAVSPVVATLILILIAVAAAAALYLWLVAWQGGVTGTVGNPTPQTTVSIGGSTSVYPFTQLAVTQFQQNQTDIAVSLQQGGSGAGMLSVCANNVDIGEASALETVSQLQEPVASGGYGCAQSPVPVITTVAYDAVDLIVPTANTHGLISISADTVLSIYVAGGGGTTAFTGSPPGGGVYAYHMNGLTGAAIGVPTGTGFTWNEIPACAPVATLTCAGEAEAATTGGVGAGGAACAGFPNDICGAATTPCGMTVCAGGANNVVQQWGRSDTSGTEQSFTARILGIGDSAGTTAGLAYTGCSPDGQLASCGINAPSAQLGNGNPGVISGVAAHPDAIGFASDGLARASGSGVTFVPLEAVGQTAAVTPSTGSSGTIATGILGNTVTGYQGWRPFEYVTLGTPTGETERFIQFVLQPQNNQAFATESAEVSIYSI
jgi:phosphate transport system substrate-binding protein